MDELIPIGPLRISIKRPEGVHGRNVNLLVSGQKIFGYAGEARIGASSRD